MATVRGNPVAWQNFYKTARWRRLRKFQLAQYPLCKFCLERGIVTAASVVDHVVPHKGDWTEFVTGKLQSLCEPCHRSAKRQIELRGYRCDIGIDGFPTDPWHPFYRARRGAQKAAARATLRSSPKDPRSDASRARSGTAARTRSHRPGRFR